MSNEGSPLDDFDARLRELAADIDRNLADRADALRRLAPLAARGDDAALAELGDHAHRLRGIAGDRYGGKLGEIAAAAEMAAKDGRSREAARHARQAALLAEAVSRKAVAKMPSRPPGALARPDAGGASTRRRLLVVDDDPDALRLVKLMLGAVQGYVVVTASTPEEALDRVISERFDGVVLDAMMHAIDGLTVCRAIRARGEPRIPVLMLSAASADELGWAAEPDGPDAWLMKPVDRATLTSAVRKLLR